MYRRLFATADAVTVNSEFTRGRVVALGCPEDKLHRLPVGLDLRAFPFRERSRRDDEPARLLTVARLVEIKGHEEMLRCIARLREVHPGLRYDIVGEGPLRPKLERLITELRLHHTVTLHGARGSRFVRRLLRDAHLAVLASVSIEGDAEGQGLFLQEAQACGLPVVATRHGALPEGLQEGRSGFLVPERNVDALTDRLNHLLTHPELWPVMGRAGRLFVEERYDITKLNAQLVELYRAARTSYRNRSS
jgi:colanic acid/amylovoran biosynthesis glycosyltransferase